MRWDGECARGEVPPPPPGHNPAEGETARVAERRVRTWSFGGPRRSADFVSSLRSAVRDGRRGGDGRGKVDWEGGGEGEASMMFQGLLSVFPGKILASIGTGDAPALNSISGRVLERAAVAVSSWKRPPAFFGFGGNESLGGGGVGEREGYCSSWTTCSVSWESSSDEVINFLRPG